MKKLLYIGHAFHNKTKSTQFLQTMFKMNYEVTIFDFDPYNDSFEIFNKLRGQHFDIVVLFQIMPPISQLKKVLFFDKISFFPMFDGVPPLNDYIWKEYKNCNIINFSKTLHLECRKRGFSSFYIQFFPKPQSIDNWGNETSVFLWQRISIITPQIIEKTLDIKKINTIYLHQVPDPCHKIVPPPKDWEDKVKVSTWFDTKVEMEEYLQQAAIYYAPRKHEGIGMSFLGAMALGRCVIAPNYPTMNEYIEDGVNGFLYDLNNPQQITIKDVRQIQSNTISFIHEGYQKWEKEKAKILEWIEIDPNKNFSRILFKKAYKKTYSFKSLFPKKVRNAIKKTLLFQIYKKLVNIKRGEKNE